MASFGKREYVDRFMAKFREEWGADEVERLMSALVRTAEAIWAVKAFALEPGEEPWRPPTRR